MTSLNYESFLRKKKLHHIWREDSITDRSIALVHTLSLYDLSMVQSHFVVLFGLLACFFTPYLPQAFLLLAAAQLWHIHSPAVRRIYCWQPRLQSVSLLQSERHFRGRPRPQLSTLTDSRQFGQETI